MLKVVVIDKNEKLFDEIQKLIGGENYEVIGAKTGKEGQLAVFKSKPDAIVLNLSTENHSGFEVLDYLRKTFPTTRRIRIKDQDNPPEWEKFSALFNATIAKPLNYKELKIALNPRSEILMAETSKDQTLHDETTEEANDSLFTSINLKEMLFGSNVLFDVFVRLGENKFLKILFAGDPFSKERFQKYVDKGVNKLYFKAFDRNKFLKYQSLILERMMESEKLPSQIKLNQLKNMSEKILEEVQSFGFNPELLDYSINISNHIYKAVSENDQMFSIVNKMFVVEPNLYSHSHHVSLLCVMLAKAMKWTSQTTSQIFSLAGLYHDTGKIKLPEHLRMKRPENMTPDELVEYRKHPILSVQEIKEIKKIPPVVPQIIIQHHENLLGTGFPAGLRSNDMTQGAKILAVANDFTNLVTFNPEFKGKPREAAQFMLLNPDRIYMQELLVALLQIFLA